MISRIRLIITALLGCHLLLVPALLTSQLRSSSARDESSPFSLASGLFDLHDQATSNAPQTAPSEKSTRQPAPTKTAAPSDQDEGMKVMEEVVEQQIEEQALGPPRPAANVVLNRDDVLIRANEQQKTQDIYKVRGNV